METKFLFKSLAATAVCAFAITSSAEIPGGWLDKRWDPESTNNIPQFAMPTSLRGPDSAQPAAVTRTKAVARSVRSAASTSSLSFTPAGLVGRLPVPDDSRIQELARGLDHDWERCFEFVRNHIVYSPYPGIVKGPERTLLDREGNAADQAFLLCALLRASGYDTATVLYLPLDSESSDSGLIIPLHNNDGVHPYCAATWLAASNDYLLWARLSPNGLSYNRIDSTHIAIEHYWVRVEIDGRQVHLDPSIKPQPRTYAKNAKSASGYNRDAFLAAAGGTVDSNSVKGLSESGIANYLKDRIADLKAAWNAPGASPDTVLGRQAITPYAEGDPRFHGLWSDQTEPIDLLVAPADTVNALRAKVTLDNHGNGFETPPGEPGWTTEFSFYLDEVASRTLWFARDSIGDLGFFVNEDKVSQSAIWTSVGNASVGVNVAYANHPSYHSYTMLPEDGHVHVLCVNLGGDSNDGIRKVATKRISELRARGIPDSDNVMRAALLQLQGQQWLSQSDSIVRLWSKVTDYDKGSFYNIGIAGQTAGPFVDMANSWLKGYGESGLIDSYGFFRSALEHSVIEQLNGSEKQAVSTAKILTLANASGNPVYFMTSNNVSTVTSALSGYSNYQKNAFATAVANGEVYLLPKNATVTLNKWTGTGYVEHGQNAEGSVHTGMIISGGMNGGYCTEVYDPESGKTITYCWVLDEHQNAAGGNVTQADPVSMPSGAFLDSEVDLAVSRATPLAWTRQYDTRSSGTNGELGRGWSHGFDASVFESSDADAALGGTSLDAVLPAVVATVVAEDLVSGTSGLSNGEIARRLTAAALVANWWTKQLPQTCITVKIGAKSLSFQKMPDGSYAPAPGVTATLTQGAYGQYTLQERHGNTYRFNWKNRLEEVEDPSGNKTQFSYEYDAMTNALLTKVENSFGASMTISHDANGRIASVTDNSGKSVSYAYDANGCLSAVTDAAGEVWTYAYDPSTHKMVSKKNPNGDFLIQNTYNGYGQVTNQVSSNGQTWRFGYAATEAAWNEDPKGGRLSQTFDDDARDLSSKGRDGAVSQADYDGHGHVAVATDALGNRTTFTYDARDNLLSTTEGSGGLMRNTRLGYDEQDRLIAVTNALGHVTTYEYDTCDRVIRKTLPDGTYTVNTWNSNGTLAGKVFHDASGNVLRRTVIVYGAYGLPTSKTITGPGLPALGITTRTEYNADGSVAATIDALGNRTTFAYDAAGRLLSTTDALGNTDSVEYNKAGQIVSARDALGRRTRTTRTVSGLPLRTIRADGTTMETVYDAVEEIVSTTDTRGAQRTVERDAENRPVAAVDALGNVSQVAYDVLGRLTWAQDASGVEKWTEYDILSRPVSSVNVLGATWTTSFDKLDRAVASTTPLGNTSRISYNSVGQIVATTRPTGAVDAFAYDAMGNQTTYTNSEKRVYRTAFDALGRITASTNALGVQVEALSYDLNGNIVRSEDGNGVVRTFAYDALDRLVSRTTPDDSVLFSYDAVGNLVSAANATATETFAYDALNRLVAATTSVSGMTICNEWQRDAGGLVTNIVYATGKLVSKRYDIEGRLVSVCDWIGREWSFNWDAAGRLIRLSSPDGRVRTQSYDSVGRLVSWNVGSLVGRSIEYDIADRKTSDTVTFGAMPIPTDGCHSDNVFDAADRLISSTVELGNGTTRIETFAYDGNDAMIHATANGDTISFSYDADHTLTTMSVDGNEATFAYDALGNRILAGNHIWIPDQSDAFKRPLLEYDSSGNLIRTYIWSGGMLLGYVEANGTLIVAHTDETGGIAALSKMDGTVLHTAQYGPHGENWGRSGTNPTPFAWLGGYGVQRLAQDTFIGDLYLTRHRLYAPAKQRFLSSDPMGLAGGLNLYAYCNGNPVRNVDPLGLCSYDINTKPPEEVDWFWGGYYTYQQGDTINFPDGDKYTFDKKMTLQEFQKMMAEKRVNDPTWDHRAEMWKKGRVYRDTVMYNEVAEEMAYEGTELGGKLMTAMPAGRVGGKVVEKVVEKQAGDKMAKKVLNDYVREEAKRNARAANPKTNPFLPKPKTQTWGEAAKEIGDDIARFGNKVKDFVGKGANWVKDQYRRFDQWAEKTALEDLIKKHP